MNKGINLVSGKYVLFLNAGDVFVNSNVLKEVLSYSVYSNADVLYGNCILHKEQYYKTDKARDINTIKQKLPFCHQCVFTKSECLKDYYYNEKYKICADFDFYLNRYLEGKRFEYMDIYIAIYEKKES